MRTSLYDVSRSIYGREASNMQPVAFGYVPAKKRSDSAKSIRESAPCAGDGCKDRDRLYNRPAVAN